MKISKSKKIVALLLVLMFCISLATPVFALSVVKSSKITGSAKNSSVFYVNVSTSNATVKFEQTKGTMSYNNWIGTSKSFNSYGGFRIKIQKLTYGAKVVSTKYVNWDMSKTETIKLDKNTPYKITVVPYDHGELQVEFIKKGAMNGWKKYPTWKIKSYKNVNCFYKD